MRKAALVRNWTVPAIGVLAVILFLLGRSMVRHRFFEGGGFHGNGYIGQQQALKKVLVAGRMIPSYALLDVKISCERLTRK
jgi:hypothetical protein